jgi:anti-sigma28 factor (negative regulator of flagellin synthesis)
MQTPGQDRMPNPRHASDVAHIARPESVVILAATVRAAREMLRRDRIAGLKERVTDGGYAVSSKDLAQRVLSNQV